MNKSTLSQIPGLVAALSAGAFLVNVSAPAASVGTRVGLWCAWSMATAMLVWAGGARHDRQF